MESLNERMQGLMNGLDDEIAALLVDRVVARREGDKEADRRLTGQIRVLEEGAANIRRVAAEGLAQTLDHVTCIAREARGRTSAGVVG